MNWIVFIAWILLAVNGEQIKDSQQKTSLQEYKIDGSMDARNHYMIMKDCKHILFKIK